MSSTCLGSVIDFTQIAYGLEVRCQNGLLRVELIGQTVRFWASRKTFGSDPSYSVVSKVRATTGWQELSDDIVLRIKTEHLRIEITRNETQINIWDVNNAPILIQGHIQFSEQKTIVVSKLHSEDAIYGGGLRNGTVNQRGRHLEFWNSNDPAPEMKGHRSMYTCIPFVTMHRPGVTYGMFYDTVAHADLACGNEAFGTENLLFESIDSDVKFYLIPGPSPAEVLDRYTDLTGRIELAPLWALHFGHSRYGIDTWEQLQHRVLRYRERGMPLSVVYLDLDYMVGNRPWTWNEATFGKIEEFLSWLHEKNIHVVLIIDPLIPELPNYHPFQELLNVDGFCKSPTGALARFNGYAGQSGLPDIFRPEVFNIIKKWFQLWSKKYGVSWWLDKTEPALCAETSEDAHRAGLDNDTLRKDAVVHSVGGVTVSHGLRHNAFGMRLAQAAHYGALKARPKKRPFIIVRSGCAGSQRFGWTWTGDNYSDEGSLANGLRQLITMGLSGWPLSPRIATL